MGIEAKIIADSIGHHNRRLTTFQLKFHRFILPEFNTHRVFSRNASSSRAIPVAKMIEQVLNDPAMPIHWGQNQPGMQANEELDSLKILDCKKAWREAALDAVKTVKRMNKTGLHKQVANRLLEPFQWIHVVMTTTELSNFFALRDHKDAQPEIAALAKLMRKVYDESTPKVLQSGEWHIPYVGEDELDEIYRSGLDYYDFAKISSARCARVSYLKHDGTSPSREDDLDLFTKLAGSWPVHFSPLEHVAQCSEADIFYANHRGWTSYRWFYEKWTAPNLGVR